MKLEFDSDKEGSIFTGVLYDVRTKRDGGGRIQIDFGGDSLQEIQYIQQVIAQKNCLLQVALVPYRPEAHNSQEFKPDENGEIEI